MKIFILTLIPFFGLSQSHLQKLDVIDYTIAIEVKDSDNNINASSSILIKFDQDQPNQVSFDLVQLNELGLGMQVSGVYQDNDAVQFKQKNDELIIQMNTLPSNKQCTFKIDYSGTPIDGLVIGKNKFGNRTFFGDNWPNRAHHWFPCVDHPSEKATISFHITHPDHYTCISNGALEAVTRLKSGSTLTSYKSMHPLPTKVMVFGLAKLESDTLVHLNNLKHVNFVYPENKTEGFKDMAVAKDPLLFFESNIAPYPYEKLFNVQSTTRYGGMENAGCIFYDENAVTGNEKMENLIAHEIAHQWFGNSVSEADWSHLWLSEGFATYFTNLHIEHKYGRDKMNEQLVKDRNRVIGFRKMIELPLKDTLTQEPLKMLNPNAYQKGAWILHMLRNRIGDQAFWQGIQQYYQAFKYSNATSSDFQAIMQKNTKIDLNIFFEQWLCQKGHPILRSKLINKNGKQYLSIAQIQDSLFSFPIEVQLNSEKKETKRTLVMISDYEHLIELDFGFKVASFILDPEINLLFEKSKSL
ncbi:MAG: M1 family metallopeptidase [Crocinitomicaceae bacterium]|nr:M1 family metallopeptidase [Crocinitomicaceae bacterium]